MTPEQIEIVKRKEEDWRWAARIMRSRRDQHPDGSKQFNAIDGEVYILETEAAALESLLAEREELLASLSGLVEVLRERHYGRMPNEVQTAFDKARAAIDAAMNKTT